MTKKDPLESIFNSPKIEPFIRKIVFSNFKNIEKLQELTFDYPITVLVGQNGTNKTSALVALYGAVDGKVPSDYWFTTPIDKSEENSYQSYWYSYKDQQSGLSAEVFQHNNQKIDRNADYWETDRPKAQFGMKTVENKKINSTNLSGTRWKKIKKEVVYINFRSELSAFDRCLYHSINPSNAYKTRQDFIRAKSKNLKSSIEKQSTSHILY
ncbi:AAA family ATPase, partial [Testudinibacter sp. TR-2022]